MKGLSPDLIQQLQAFLGHGISGHHFAVMAFGPFSVQQSHLGQFAQSALGTGRRDFYAPADVMAVEFSGLAVLTGAGAYAAAGFSD